MITNLIFYTRFKTMNELTIVGQFTVKLRRSGVRRLNAKVLVSLNFFSIVLDPNDAVVLAACEADSSSLRLFAQPSSRSLTQLHSSLGLFCVRFWIQSTSDRCSCCALVQTNYISSCKTSHCAVRALLCPYKLLF